MLCCPSLCCVRDREAMYYVLMCCAGLGVQDAAAAGAGPDRGGRPDGKTRFRHGRHRRGKDREAAPDRVFPLAPAALPAGEREGAVGR